MSYQLEGNLNDSILYGQGQNRMRIKEVSKRTGLSIYTLRYYEKIGLIDRRLVARIANNYRENKDSIVNDMHTVKKSAQRAGFALAEIIFFDEWWKNQCINKAVQNRASC